MHKLPTGFLWTSFALLGATILVGWVLAPFVLEDQISRQTQMNNDSYAYKKWKNPTNDIFMSVYFFNVTNPEEVKEGATPVFTEIGPYTYEEKRTPHNITYNEDDDTISFEPYAWFYFREDMSVGSEDDLVTTINIPLVGASQKIASFPRMIRYLAGVYIKTFKEDLFIQRTAGELFMRGYYSEMVENLQNLVGEEFAPNNMIGVYYGRNGTSDGQYVMNAGNKDTTQFGRLSKWEGHDELHYWPNSKCNEIKGSDSAVFPSNIRKTDTLSIYQKEFCRTMYLRYNRSTESFGIPTYRFDMVDDIFESFGEHPDYQCFPVCSDTNKEGCFEKGVQPMEVCRKGAPVTISYPHFLNAPYYQNKVIGLKPDRALHMPFMEVEPALGIAVRAHKRGQVNVDLKPVPGFDGFANVPTLQFPVLWMDEYMTIDNETLARVRNEYQLPMKIFEAGRWTFLGVSMILVGIASAMYVTRAKSKYNTFSILPLTHNHKAPYKHHTMVLPIEKEMKLLGDLNRNIINI